MSPAGTGPACKTTMFKRQQLEILCVSIVRKPCAHHAPLWPRLRWEHPGAQLEEVFAGGQRIGGGKKVQRIGTVCRKCTASCSQLALETDFQYNDSLLFIHLNPILLFRTIWTCPVGSNLLYTLYKTGFRLPLSLIKTVDQTEPQLEYVFIWFIWLFSGCREGRGDFVEKWRILNTPQLKSLNGIHSLTLEEWYFKVLSKTPLRFLQLFDIRGEHAISSAMLSHLISPTKPNN